VIRKSAQRSFVIGPTIATLLTRSAIPVGSVSRLGEINLRTVGCTSNSQSSTQQRFAESFYNSQTRSITSTARGVRNVRHIDGQERTVRREVVNIAPVNYSYDLRGRLQEIKSGSAADERILSMAYDSFGYVNEITDPLNRKVLLENDAIGRTKKMTLPDKRVVEFEYDANNNLTGIKPPGRPWHNFEYGQQDELKKYLPPAALATGLNSTEYAYNKVPQPLLETRPGGETLQAAYQNTLLQSLALNSGSYSWEYSGRRPIKQTTPLQGACAIEQTAGYQGYFVANAAWRRCGALLGVSGKPPA